MEHSRHATSQSILNSGESFRVAPYHRDVVDRPVVCPVLIGRTAQLDALTSCIDGAVAGTGQLLLIAGEAGIGKSRLVAEAAAVAAAHGCLVLRGACFEPDRSAPYAPFLEILRRRVHQAATQPLAPDAELAFWELFELLPDLRSLAHARRDAVSAVTAIEPAQLQRRIFATLSDYLAKEAALRPLLLVVEDLHWCDDTSLDVLRYLARLAAAQPLAVLLTYRSDEIGPALARLLAHLDRERAAQELLLARLDRDQADAMVRAIFALERPVRPAFLQALYTRTEGNPFAIEETIKSLISTGGIFFADGVWDRKPLAHLEIPRSVQHAVQQRVARLSRRSREVLAVAAVAGRRFDFAILHALLPLDEQALLQVLREFVAAQLVVEEAPDQFAFRHALTREAIYSRLLARERQVLHRRVAETLEHLVAGTPETRLADLSYHAFEARLWDTALVYARRAGDQAAAMYAPHAAAEHYGRALQAAAQLGVAAPMQLHRARGRAYESLGEFAAARADYEQALARARAGSDRRAEWQALIDVGFLWASRDYVRTGEYFEQALEHARALGDAALIAESLNRVGNWHVNVQQPREALRFHLEAKTLFEQVHDRRGVAETTDLLGMASLKNGDCRQALHHYERAIAMFRALDVRASLASSLAATVLLGGAYVHDETIVPGGWSLVASEAAGEEALRISRDTNYRSGEAFALLTLGCLRGSHGLYAPALESLQAGLEIASAIEHRQWTAGLRCALGALYLDLLAPTEARRELEHALVLAQQTGSLIWQHLIASVLVRACLADHDIARAAAVLDTVCTLAMPQHAHGQRQCWYARAELELARNDAHQALEIADRLIATAANVDDRGERALPRLGLLRGLALAKLGRSGAEAALRAAREGAAGSNLRPLQWRIEAALGGLFRAGRRGAEAEQAFAAAWTTARDLAAGIADHALRDAFLGRFADRVPPAGRMVEKAASGGLTRREREVAALLAAGLSNRLVAQRLVLSERTVEDHVSNILGKLGFTSRAHIAAWAVEHGLAQPGA